MAVCLYHKLLELRSLIMDPRGALLLMAIFFGSALSIPIEANYVKGLQNYRIGSTNASIGNYLILWEKNGAKAWTLKVTKGQELVVSDKSNDTEFTVYKYKDNGTNECIEEVFNIFEVSKSVDKSAVGKIVAVSGNRIVLKDKPTEWKNKVPSLTLEKKTKGEFIFRRGFQFRHPLYDIEGHKIFGLETVLENDESETQQWIVEPQSKRLTISEPTMKFNFDRFFKLVQVS